MQLVAWLQMPMVNEYDQERSQSLQTNPRYREEETQNTTSHKTAGSKASLLLSEMIAKLERTLSTAYKNKDQTKLPHTIRASTNNDSTTA